MIVGSRMLERIDRGAFEKMRGFFAALRMTTSKKMTTFRLVMVT
jgi:hypothetical protein